MRDQKAFTRMLLVTFGIVTALYSSFAVLGVSMYGRDVRCSEKRGNCAQTVKEGLPLHHHKRGGLCSEPIFTACAANSSLALYIALYIALRRAMADFKRRTTTLQS